MNILKGGLIFLIGAAAGAVTTYFVTKKIYEEELEAAGGPEKSFKDADHMTEDDLKEYYLEGLRDLGYGVEERFIGGGEEVNPVENEDEFWDTEDVEDDEEDSDFSPVEANPVPYEITTKEFGVRDDYSSETLSWYKDDLTMTDDDDTPIDEWKRHVGIERVDDILKDSDSDAIYVRNEVEMCDYEILIFRDSYKHAVLGEDDDLGDMAD